MWATVHRHHSGNNNAYDDENNYNNNIKSISSENALTQARTRAPGINAYIRLHRMQCKLNQINPICDIVYEKSVRKCMAYIVCIHNVVWCARALDRHKQSHILAFYKIKIEEEEVKNAHWKWIVFHFTSTYALPSYVAYSPDYKYSTSIFRCFGYAYVLWYACI